MPDLTPFFREYMPLTREEAMEHVDFIERVQEDEEDWDE